MRILWLLSFLIFVYSNWVAADAIKIELASVENWQEVDGGVELYSVTVQIAQNQELNVVAKTYSNGLGTVAIGGQTFYASDGHADGAVYDNDFLDISFIDLNGDGIRDIVFNGIVNYSGEKDREIYERESALFIYLYDQKAAKFILKYRSANFDLESPNDASNEWWKRFYCPAQGEALKGSKEKGSKRVMPLHFLP